MKKPLTPEEIREKRRQENEDLLRRAQTGDNITGMAGDSWFPPRPTIQKNRKDVESIFGVVSQESNKEGEE